MSKLYIVTLLLLFPFVSFGQFDFNIDLAVGQSFSRLPKIKNKGRSFHNDVNLNIKYSNPSPLVGINAKVIYLKNIVGHVGFEYLYSNVNESSRIKGVANTYKYGQFNWPYSSESKTNYRFHKLNLPVGIGYVFSSHKYKPSLVLGGSLNYLIGTKYKYIISKQRNNEDFYEYEINSNLFDKVENSPIDKWQGQYFMLISMSTSDKIDLKFRYAFGANKYYTFGNRTNNLNHEIPNCDISMSVAYRII